MLDLSKTTDLVKKELESDLYLLEILKEDLVNTSALARKILSKIKEENPKATVESIAIAIKRYIAPLKKKKIAKAVAEIISNSQLATKNDVVHVTFKRNNEVLKLLSEVSKRVRWDDEEIFFINQGSGEVTILVDKKNKYMLDDCQKYEIETTLNLTIISIKENLEKGKEKSIDIPGVYAYFINQLARKSINLIAVVSTYSQVTVAFKSKDFVRAYETLQNCIDHFRKKG